MSKTWLLPAAVAAIAAVLVVALGTTITDLGPWYQALEKPAWQPPDEAFPIGWTLIYAFNTAAIVTLWLAARTARMADTVISLFAFSAFLNITWSMLFFRMQRPDWAFIEVLLLWLTILALVVYSARISRPAAALFTPYLVWMTFAAASNWAIVELNGPFG